MSAVSAWWLLAAFLGGFITSTALLIGSSYFKFGDFRDDTAWQAALDEAERQRREGNKAGLAELRRRQQLAEEGR